MAHYEVTAEHSEGWWTLVEPTLGAVSQVRRLDQAEDEMTPAIADLAGISESDVQVTVTPILADELRRTVTVATEAAFQFKQSKDYVSRTRSEAAAILEAAGLSLRDVGKLLGVSYQRAAPDWSDGTPADALRRAGLIYLDRAEDQ